MRSYLDHSILLIHLQMRTCQAQLYFPVFLFRLPVREEEGKNRYFAIINHHVWVLPVDHHAAIGFCP